MDAITREEERVRAVLAPLDRVDAVTLRRNRPRRRWVVLAPIGGLAALVCGGIATAAGGWGPLAGIAVADHTRTPSDVVGAGVVAQLREDEAPGGDQIGARLPDSARLVGRLPSGRRVYVVPTTKGRLCIVLERLAESCGDPLTQAAPATFTVVDRDGPGGKPPVAYGVTRDGVKSLSFRVGGRPETVPVHGNVFVFEGQSWDSTGSFSTPTVNS